MCTKPGKNKFAGGIYPHFTKIGLFFLQIGINIRTENKKRFERQSFSNGKGALAVDATLRAEERIRKMKKIRKIISVFAVIAIMTAVFASCGEGGTNSSNNSSSGGAAEFDTSRDITVVSREEGSGTRDAFVELTGVLSKDSAGNKTDNTTEEAVIIDGTQAVMSHVVGNKYSIGYISLGSLNDTVSAVKVGGVAPSAETIKDGTYAIARPFMIATKSEISEVASDFIDYILSTDGQKIVGDNGCVAIDAEAPYTGSSPSGKIVIAGSSSVSPVMEKLKEAYLAINTNAQIEIQTNDSSSGLMAASEGTCDIGMSSRELKDSEKASLTAVRIAMDGIAVIVNKDNSFTDLTTDQIKSIYTGEAVSWSDITK